MQENQKELIEALQADGKSSFEALMGDISATIKELTYMMSNLSLWMREERRPIDMLLTLAMDAASVQYEPYGVCLIIGTWNYPVNTVLIPLIGAISAGNCAVVKLSEVCENTSAFLAEKLPEYLDKECFHIVNGSVKEATELLAMKWDHIFYTGNGTVGRVIAKAAAANLTPCILELGGKSPVIVDKGVHLKTTAKRLAFGKWFNNGQTCIAPDYILIPRDIRDEFVNCLKEVVSEFYGENPQESESYGRIVNDRHWSRLMSYLASTKGNVVIGGDGDIKKRFICPTVVVNVDPETDRLMKEEIFGPIMPIIDCETVEDAIDLIRSKYVFYCVRRHIF